MSQTGSFSVEVGGQASVQMMLIQPRELGLGGASGGQRRQRVDRKEVHRVRLVADRCRTPRELAQEEQLGLQTLGPGFQTRQLRVNGEITIMGFHISQKGTISARNMEWLSSRLFILLYLLVLVGLGIAYYSPSVLGLSPQSTQPVTP